MSTQITNLILIICSIFFVGSGIKSILNKTRRLSDIVLALVMFFMAIWSMAIDFTTLKADMFASSFLFSAAEMAISLILLYTLTYSPSYNKKKTPFLVLIPAIIVAGITLLPHAALTSVIVENGHVKSTYGFFFPIYNLATVVYALLIAFYYRKIIPKLRGNIKIELKYTMTSFGIAAVFTILSTIILPSIGTSDFVYFGPISMLALVAGTTYGLSKHRLLGAQVIASELLSITLILIVLIWIVVNFSLFNLVLFVCVTVISFLFIRSSIIEASERLEIEKKEKQLEKDKVELESLDKLKDEFIMMATHELSTPLSIIKSTLSMVFDEEIHKLNNEDKNFLRPVYLSSKRASDLFGKIIQITNLESSNFSLIKEEVDFVNLAKESTESCGQLADNKKVEITTSFPADALPLIKIDKAKIKQVAESMIKNAITFSNPDSKINVAVKKDGKDVVFSVMDHGRGIAPENKIHIYEKFYQFERFDEANPQEQQGSGLSLFISKKIINFHGGKTWFESEPGHGSTFYFSLPTE